MSNESEYLYSTGKVGIRVVIHERNSHPFPNVDGFSFGPGTKALVAIEYVNMMVIMMERSLHGRYFRLNQIFWGHHMGSANPRTMCVTLIYLMDILLRLGFVSVFPCSPILESCLHCLTSSCSRQFGCCTTLLQQSV